MINTIKYITLNFLRKYIRLINKNKVKLSVVVLAVSFLLLFSVDIYKTIDVKYYRFLPLIIFLYAMLKLFQEIPTMNMDSQLIELKILKLWQLKMLVFIKSIALSILIFIILINTSMFSQKFLFQQIGVSLIINIIVNIVCFLVYQINHSNILKIAIIFSSSVAYYLSSIPLISILLLVILVIFASMEYFKYDLILPYYHSMGNIIEGLINSDMEGMVAGQASIVKSKSESTLYLMEKNYNKKNPFYYSKEISRMLYHNKNWINLSLMNFLAVFIVIMYSKKILLSVIVLLLIFYTTDNMLNLLNKSEAMNRNKGFFFPYSTQEILKQKYIVHLLIIFIPFILPGILLLKRLSFFTLLICFISLPIKNILTSFAVNKRVKWLSYLIDSGIFYICFLNLL